MELRGGAALERASAKMTQRTRADSMTALRSISGYQAPLLLSGIPVDLTHDDESAISKVNLAKYDSEGFAPVTAY